MPDEASCCCSPEVCMCSHTYAEHSAGGCQGGICRICRVEHLRRHGSVTYGEPWCNLYRPHCERAISFAMEGRT
jgi:hypothetical protein